MGDEHFVDDVRIIHDPEANTENLEGPLWRDIEADKAVTRMSELQSEFQFDHVIAGHAHYYGQAWTMICANPKPKTTIICHGLEIRRQLMLAQRLHDVKLRLTKQEPSMRSELKRSLVQADYVVTNSESTKRLVQQLIETRPVEVVGCGIDPNVLHEMGVVIADDAASAKHAARRQLNLDPSLHYIGFVGRLTKQKNVATLMRVLAKLPDTFRGLIVGDGPEKPSLQTLSRQLGVEERIIWAGTVSEDLKWTWFQALDVSFLLSKLGSKGEIEGFGISILESFAAGTPVIAGNIGGTDSFIIDGKIGYLVNPTDERSIVRLTRRLSADRQLSTAMVDRGRAKISERFTWHHVAKRILDSWEAR